MFLFFLWNFVFSHRVCRGYSECETYDTNDLLIQALKQLDCDVVQRDIRVTLNQNITLSIADMPKCAYHKFLSESEPSNIIIIGSPSSSSDSLALTLDLEKADSSRFNYAQIDAEYSGDFYLAFKGTSWNLTSLKVDKKVNLLPGSAQNVNLHVIDADIHHNFLQAFKTVNFVQLTVSNSKSDRSITYPNFVQRLQYPEANYLKFDVIENFTVSFNYNKMTMATSDSKKTIDFTLPTYNYTFGFSFDLSEKLYCTFQGDLNYTYPLGGRFFVQHQNDVITFKSGNYLDPDFSYSAGYDEIIHWETNLPVSSLSITNNALLYHDSELINAS
ncbi:hypothetical protein TRFO_08270 [Tritrichomonas foetus]|uniref:Uncharacterized protein n=1 Tax=Tritrichomonas foetus TaxID=1144522 RepID=A0A1J4JLT3_9EUKA|nr:hypothetical protein TRFO_08270 [Tritrichomonas foetus]|eukprot:OHS99649.1 hypothetical protein TRFO_08270 [Tritrichomonas foetus]